MLKLKSVGLVLLVGVNLAGCESVHVYQSDKVVENRISGIPFYERELVFFQETRIAQTQWQVRFSVKESESDKTVVNLPRAGAALASCMTRARLHEQINRLLVQVDKKPYSAVIEQLEQALSQNEPLGKPNPAECDDLISNVVKHEVRPGRKLYITNVAPLFGSASADFTFNPDGTLASTANSVQPVVPENAAAIAGLLPIKEYLSKKWKVASDDKKRDDIPVEISVTITPIKTVYTLRNDLQKATDGLTAPLTLAHARSGTPLVQLVSTETITDAAAEKANPKAFQIKGSIVPPEASQ